MLAVLPVSRARGFSIIEMMITLVIVAVLLMLAMPNFRDWIQNAQIRTSAESLLNGVQLARMEAVRRNVSARFQLVSSLGNSCAGTTAGRLWVVSVFDATGLCDLDPDTNTTPNPATADDDPLIVQKSGSDIGANVTVLADLSSIVFSSLGRPTPTPASFIKIDVTNTSSGGTCVKDGGAMRCLRIEVSPGGQVRMCDTAVSTAGDPRKCESAV